MMSFYYFLTTYLMAPYLTAIRSRAYPLGLQPDHAQNPAVSHLMCMNLPGTRLRRGLPNHHAKLRMKLR